MSTDDDFEADLRARLADLADHEDDWDDPLPEARRRAAEGAVDEVGAVEPAAPARRRLLPGLAIAATVAALLVGGGFGLRALTRTSDTSGASAGSAAEAGGAAGSCATGGGPCFDTGTTGPSAASPQAPSAVSGGSPSGGSPSGGSPAGGADTAGCAATGKAVSTGPLADIATIRPSGIAQPHTTSGGSAGISYQLTFGETAGRAQLRAATAAWTVGGVLCASPAALTPGAIQVVPVSPGAGLNGSVVFTANDSRGQPLPAGSYQVVLVIPYSIDGATRSQLVSPPVTVVVS